MDGRIVPLEKEEIRVHKAKRKRQQRQEVKAARASIFKFAPQAFVGRSRG